MARPLRIQFPGALYHVTSRGDGREDIYRTDEDRSTWLNVLADVCARCNWACHAWCQMTNHYHIVVETAEPNLAAGMRHLNGVYTQRFNRRHDRVGHVFQGRYKAILVDREAYLLALARYVVLNPVRAQMVDDVAQWPWSSYCATAGTAPQPTWLRPDAILSSFAIERRQAIPAYMAFVQSGIGMPSIWNDLRGQIYLCSDAWLKSFEQEHEAIPPQEIPRAQRRPLPQPLAAYRHAHEDPHRAMAAAYSTGGYTMREIAAAFDVHYSTVSRAVRAFGERLDNPFDAVPAPRMRDCKT